MSYLLHKKLQYLKRWEVGMTLYVCADADLPALGRGRDVAQHRNKVGVVPHSPHLPIVY